MKDPPFIDILITMTTAAIISIIIFSLLSVFQLLLIVGAPLGHFAWGGQHKTLPRKLRVGSAVSILIYAAFIVCILSKAAIWPILPEGTFLDVSLWIMTAYLTLGILLNAISRSRPERYTMTPVVFVLTICLFIIASS